MINHPNEAEFIQLILKRLGIITLPNNKELHHIITAACEKFNCNPEDYLRMLQASHTHSPALEHLIAGITVGETYFFRDNQQIQLLKNTLLPRIIKHKRQQQDLSLRIWSAGCASGEEIYTIAMMLTELLPDKNKWKLHLLGTDINAVALQKAILGRYNKWSMRSIPSDSLKRYFTESNNQYVLSPTIMEMVHFNILNLSENTFPSMRNNTNAQDLIICRNVLIYFDSHSINHFMKKISLSLADNGYLLLGASDPVCIDHTDLVFHHHEGLVFSRKVATEKVIKPSPTPHVHRPVKLASNAFKETAIEVKPCPVAMLNANASEAANAGLLDKAFQLCQDSLHIDTTNKDTYYIYSLVLLELNRLDEAEAALRKTLFLDRKFIEGHFQLGLLLIKNKRLKEGLKSLQNALDLVNANVPSQMIPDERGLTYGRFAEILNAEIAIYTRNLTKND